MLKASLDEYLAQAAGPEQPVMAIRETWGRWLLDDGRPQEAAAQFAAIVQAGGDRTLAHIALAHAGLARVALVDGRSDDALRESEIAMAKWQAVTGFRDVRMGVYMQRVRADALAAVGRVAEAQDLEDAAAGDSTRFDAPGAASTRRREFQHPAQ
jgi:serine/threonine-protein kinase